MRWNCLPEVPPSMVEYHSTGRHVPWRKCSFCILYCRIGYIELILFMKFQDDKILMAKLQWRKIASAFLRSASAFAESSLQSNHTYVILR